MLPQKQLITRCFWRCPLVADSPTFLGHKSSCPDGRKKLGQRGDNSVANLSRASRPSSSSATTTATSGWGQVRQGGGHGHPRRHRPRQALGRADQEGLLGQQDRPAAHRALQGHRKVRLRHRAHGARAQGVRHRRRPRAQEGSAVRRYRGCLHLVARLHKDARQFRQGIPPSPPIEAPWADGHHTMIDPVFAYWAVCDVV
jgi:hypothetical protein